MSNLKPSEFRIIATSFGELTVGSWRPIPDDEERKAALSRLVALGNAADKGLAKCSYRVEYR